MVATRWYLWLVVEVAVVVMGCGFFFFSFLFLRWVVITTMVIVTGGVVEVAVASCSRFLCDCFLLFVMSCLYYFKWNNKKNRSFDVKYILKWDSIKDKVTFLGIKS